jgi:hemoglobin
MAFAPCKKRENFAPPQMTFYRAIGGAAGCHALSTAFYARVEQDSVLRPLFPSTFTCAIEEFSAFLVQFLGGEPEATQRRWWLSLRESHSRFKLGERERSAWLRAMKATLMEATLEDESLIPDPTVRSELLQFFTHSSAYVVNSGNTSISGELASLWDEQLALDEVVALLRAPGVRDRCTELLQSLVLKARFARSPSVHASVLSLAAARRRGNHVLREYVLAQLRENPSLVRQRYSHGRSLLQDAAAAGDRTLVEFLLDLGAEDTADAERALYCVGNQCRAPDAARIVHILRQRTSARIDAPHGVKRCTALHMAARRGNAQVIAAFLDVGADIEVRDGQGDTPLRRAVNCGKVDAAKLLLARGADSDSVGSKKLTPALAARTVEMRQLFAA